MSVGLGLEEEVRKRFLEPEPVQLFRSFKYSAREVENCSIGEYSDFGFLTIISQNAAGLQVLSSSDKWVDIPTIPDSFVVNGEHLSSSTYPGLVTSRIIRQSVTFSTVSLPGSTSLPSIPFFFDLSRTAGMRSLPLFSAPTDSVADPAILKRWQHCSRFNNLPGIWG
jgi:isopenicillin N synthase-like dioxygenase